MLLDLQAQVSGRSSRSMHNHTAGIAHRLSFRLVTGMVDQGLASRLCTAHYTAALLTSKRLQGLGTGLGLGLAVTSLQRLSGMSMNALMTLFIRCRATALGASLRPQCCGTSQTSLLAPHSATHLARRWNCWPV